MPILQVNLDDQADCRKSIQLIRKHLETFNENPSKPNGNGNHENNGNLQANLPLKKRMEIISQRGVWQHLLAIAKDGSSPRSLPEWDSQLGLNANKMRSLKAIFAKLENRFNVCFLKLAEDAGPDNNGNPRYIMPPRIRNQILGIAESQDVSQSKL